MARLEGSNWTQSEHREALLQSWFKLSKDESSALLILGRLDTAMQRKDIGPERLLQYIRPIIEGEFPERVQLRAVGILRWIVNDKTVHDDVFDLLAGVIEDPRSRRLALPAATALKGMLLQGRNLVDRVMISLPAIR